MAEIAQHACAVLLKRSSAGARPAAVPNDRHASIPLTNSASIGKSARRRAHGTRVAREPRVIHTAPHNAAKTPLLWSSLTWEEIGNLRDSGMDAVLLPVGATEQHGPHLATSVDSVTAEKLAHAVSAETGVPVLPTLPYGCSLGHSRRWPGTISLQPQTLMDCVVQIGEWCRAFAFKRFVIINGHVTNFAPLRCALELLRSKFDDIQVAIRNVADLSQRVRHEFFADAEDWHANAAETSLMMSLAPELVRADRLGEAHDPDRTRELFFAHPVNRTSRNGVTGHPATATAEQGRKLFAMMVEDLTSQMRGALVEKPPFGHSYFSPI